jgi:hypothetical protein
MKQLDPTVTRPPVWHTPLSTSWCYWPLFAVLFSPVTRHKDCPSNQSQCLRKIQTFERYSKQLRVILCLYTLVCEVLGGKNQIASSLENYNTPWSVDVSCMIGIVPDADGDIWMVLSMCLTIAESDDCDMWRFIANPLKSERIKTDTM